MNRPKDPPNSQKKQDPKHINASVTMPVADARAAAVISVTVAATQEEHV
jgi:hypothetical protein